MRLPSPKRRGSLRTGGAVGRFMTYDSTGTPAPEAVRQELDAILASKWFRKSTSLKDFLRFVVEQTLVGRGDEIKEFVIGHEVFHRPQAYDPRSDSIVRVQARLLRQKLDLYYQNVPSTQVRIELPKGGYVPVFTVKTADTGEESPPLDPAGSETTPSPEPTGDTHLSPAPPRFRKLWMGVPALAALALTAFAWRALHPPPPARPARGPAVACSLLWGPLLNGKSPTTIVLGAPNFFSVSAGLLVRDVTVNSSYQMEHGDRLHHLSKEVANPASHPQPANFYTGVGEALGAERLNRLFWEHSRVPTMASSGHVLSTNWSNGNLIVVSSLRIQTLINQLHLPTDFVRLGAMQNVILNLHPREGEQTRYTDKLVGSEHIDYGLVSVWPGLKPGRRIILLGGDDTYGTEAVVNFVTEPQQQRILQQKLTALGAVASPSLAFQALLRIRVENGATIKGIECVAVHLLSPQPQPPQARPAAQAIASESTAPRP